jgi:tRNA A37 threonylcarbamoyltransferase TsaD
MLKSSQTPDDLDYFDFSFSGLKTATATLVAGLEEEGVLEEERQHVAAAFQDAAVDVLPGGRLFHASPRLSSDNGAMIARAGLFRMERGDVASPETSADANLPFPDLVRRVPGRGGKR